MLDPASANGCERVDAGSTILWRPDQRVMNRGGLVVDDRAMIAGCRKVGSFDEPCTITGVPLVDVRDPAAYRGQRLELHYATVDWSDGPAQASLHRWHGVRAESEEVIS